MLALMAARDSFGSCGVRVGCCAVKASSVVSCHLEAVAVVLFAGSSSESKKLSLYLSYGCD